MFKTFHISNMCPCCHVLLLKIIPLSLYCFRCVNLMILPVPLLSYFRLTMPGHGSTSIQAWSVCLFAFYLGAQPACTAVDRLVLTNTSIYLLDLPPSAVSKDANKLLLHVLTATRCLIASHWKRTQGLTMPDLYSHIQIAELMEALTARMKNTLNAFQCMWKAWVCFGASLQNIYWRYIPDRFWLAVVLSTTIPFYSLSTLLPTYRDAFANSFPFTVY